MTHGLARFPETLDARILTFGRAVPFAASRAKELDSSPRPQRPALQSLGGPCKLELPS